MKFKLWITTDNAAFDDTPNFEVSRMLRKVADRLDNGETFEFYETLFDVNGNDVGRAAFKRDEE